MATSSTTTTPASLTAAFEFASDSDRQAFVDGVKEIVDAYHRIEIEQDQVKEICHDMFLELGIPKSVIRKVARLAYKKKAAEFAEESEMVTSLYEATKTK